MATDEHSNLRVVTLDDRSEDAFFSFAKANRLDYFFFVFDWTYNRGKSQIFLALDEQGQIAGAMLVYCEHIVQVRGNRQAVHMLLDGLNEAKVELSAPLDCEDIVRAKYPSPTLFERVTLMSLCKDEEHLELKVEPQILTLADADELATLMRQVYPDHWSEMTAEKLRQMRNETVWLGIRAGGKLLALGVAAFADIGSHILFIGTAAAHRRKGYAKSLVSALAKMLLARFERATIFVIEGNMSAFNLYSEIGFRPYKQYLYLRT